MRSSKKISFLINLLLLNSSGTKGSIIRHQFKILLNSRLSRVNAHTRTARVRTPSDFRYLKDFFVSQIENSKHKWVMGMCGTKEDYFPASIISQGCGICVKRYPFAQIIRPQHTTFPDYIRNVAIAQHKFIGIGENRFHMASHIWAHSPKGKKPTHFKKHV